MKPDRIVGHIDPSGLRDGDWLAHDYMLEVEEMPRARAARELRERREPEDERITPLRLLGMVIFVLLFFWLPALWVSTAWLVR